MCNNCIHKAVCGKFRATGGVNKCEHHKEERWGHWIVNGRGLTHWAECSECNTAGSPHWKRCPVCEAKMRGAEDG